MFPTFLRHPQSIALPNALVEPRSTNYRPLDVVGGEQDEASPRGEEIAASGIACEETALSSRGALTRQDRDAKKTNESSRQPVARPQRQSPRLPPSLPCNVLLSPLASPSPGRPLSSPWLPPSGVADLATSMASSATHRLQRCALATKALLLLDLLALAQTGSWREEEKKGGEHRLLTSASPPRLLCAVLCGRLIAQQNPPLRLSYQEWRQDGPICWLCHAPLLR